METYFAEVLFDAAAAEAYFLGLGFVADVGKFYRVGSEGDAFDVESAFFAGHASGYELVTHLVDHFDRSVWKGLARFSVDQGAGEDTYFRKFVGVHVSASAGLLAE